MESFQVNCENNEPPFASFCRSLDAIISFCWRERGACKWYMVWNSCPHSVTYLLLLRSVYRIPYTLYRISFVVAATINRVWLIEYGKWNLVAVICILFITYSHFLTIWLHFVASCECPYSPASLWTGSYIWATFVCTPKLFACMTINFIQLPTSPRPEIIFALTYNRKLWQQQQQHPWERSERGRT